MIITFFLAGAVALLRAGLRSILACPAGPLACWVALALAARRWRGLPRLSRPGDGGN